MDKKQKIYCDVISCKFNNCNNICNLKEIKISCTGNKNNIINKANTICNSFIQEKE